MSYFSHKTQFGESGPSRKPIEGEKQRQPVKMPCVVATSVQFQTNFF